MFYSIQMIMVSEAEFESICKGLKEDRDAIIRHNPVGTGDQILLWMLLGCLVSYLSLEEIETPCFAGRPDANTYRDAIRFVLRGRMMDSFDIEPYLDNLIENDN